MNLAKALLCPGDEVRDILATLRAVALLVFQIFEALAGLCEIVLLLDGLLLELRQCRIGGYFRCRVDLGPSELIFELAQLALGFVVRAFYTFELAPEFGCLLEVLESLLIRLDDGFLGVLVEIGRLLRLLQLRLEVRGAQLRQWCGDRLDVLGHRRRDEEESNKARP